MSDALLDKLARAAGILPDYWDLHGRVHSVTPETQRALLAAMGFPADTPGDIRAGLDRLDRRDADRIAPSVCVVRAPTWTAPEGTRWRITCESGEYREGTGAAFDLPLGYHRLSLVDGPREEEGLLIVAPPAAYAPSWLRKDEKLWGIACHLYTVPSDRNGGMGDFADLGALMDMTAAAGGAVVAVNPFHALFPRNPEEASPYWPSSRTFLNPLYIRCADTLPAAPGALIDYAETAALKQAALRRAAARHAADPAVDTFIAAGGEALRRFCIFSALTAHMSGPWQSWPHPFRDPASAEVRAWTEGHADEVRLHAVLQWLADRQLAEAASRRMPVGLMRDLAVGVCPAGAEAWARQDLYPAGARFGAPSDAFAPGGQDWGMPPPNPHVLRDLAYAPFIATLRANMRYAGALRIDHAMALERLFWIPPGGTAADGAYVRYPMDELFAILALESVRAQCLAVGEDLGTVPLGFRERMARENMLSTRLFYFEKHDSGLFKRPDVYPSHAVAQATTHDLPTLAGYWTGTDLRVRLLLDPSLDEEGMEAERARERGLIVAALVDQGLIAEASPSDIPAEDLVEAVHAFLAASAAQLVLVNLSDVALMTTQLNVPGTTREYPNWRARLSETVDALARGPHWSALTALMRRTRGRTNGLAA